MKFPVLPPYIGNTNNIKYNIKYSSQRSSAVSAASAHICIARQFRETQPGKNPIKTSMPKIPWVIISCMQHCLFLQQHFIGVIR